MTSYEFDILLNLGPLKTLLAIRRWHHLGASRRGCSFDCYENSIRRPWFAGGPRYSMLHRFSVTKFIYFTWNFTCQTPWQTYTTPLDSWRILGTVINSRSPTWMTSKHNRNVLKSLIMPLSSFMSLPCVLGRRIISILLWFLPKLVFLSSLGTHYCPCVLSTS